MSCKTYEKTKLDKRGNDNEETYQGRLVKVVPGRNGIPKPPFPSINLISLIVPEFTER